MATRSLGVLTLDVIAKTGNFSAGMSEVERASKRASSSVARSTGKASSSVQNLGAQSSKTAQDVSALGSALNGLAAPIAAFLGTQQIAKAADEWTNISNRLKLVTESSAGLAQAQENVFRIAQEARAPLAETAELYQRIASNAEELRLSSDGVAGIVSTISKTLAISGANAESAQAALVQLGQAFASGVLRGEEFNSVMEQTPALAKTIADGLGVTIGKLRAMANDGKLTADVVVAALEKQEKAVKEQYGKIAPTISQSLTTVNNSFTKMIGTMDQSLGASTAIADAIIGVAGAMDYLAENSEVVEKALGLGVAVAGGKAVGALVQMVKAAQANAAATKAAAGAAAQKAFTDQKAALATLAVVKAEQQRAIAAVAAVNAENAATKARQVQEITRLRSVQSAIAAELELEQVRHKAQITDMGRQQSVARMAELRLSEVAIIKQLQAAEASLAVTTQANSAKAIAALEARRIATINVATAEAAATAATGARGAAMLASASAASLGAAALGKVAAAGRGLVGVLGGPVGLIVTLGLAATAFVDFGESAEKGFDAAAAAATKADERVRNLSKQILANDLKINVDTASFDQIGEAIKRAEKDLEQLESQRDRMQDILSSDVPQIGPNQVTQESLTATEEKINALTSALGKLQKAQGSSRFKSIDDAQKYLETLDKQNLKLQDLSEKEEALNWLKKNSIDINSEIATKILAQAEANDKLNDSKKETKKEDKDQESRIKRIASKYQSYVETLQTQITKVEKMTAAEKLLFDIQAGRLNGINEKQRENLVALAAEVDAKKELAKVEKDLRKIANFQGAANDDTQAAKENYRIQLAAVGLGEKQADRIRERIALEQEFARKREELLSQRNTGGINESVYKEETKILESALAERMALQENYYTQLDYAQSNWVNGATAALADYADRADDVAGQVYTSLSGALESLTEGFSEAAAKSILWAEDFDSAMKGVARSILENVLSSLIELGARYAVNAALEIAGVQAVATAKTAAAAQVSGAQIAAITATSSAAQVATATNTATQTAAATQTTAAWTPAATAASIGSFGTAAAVGLAAVIAAIAMAKGGFKKGGYTGNGSADDVAGVVHGKEFVFDAASTSRIGVANLEKLRSGRDNIGKPGAASTSDGRAVRQTVVNQVFNVKTPDADSFRMSQRQLLKRAKRSIA
jgi:lambda family phage tail tape measure protein